MRYFIVGMFLLAVGAAFADNHPPNMPWLDQSDSERRDAYQEAHAYRQDDNPCKSCRLAQYRLAIDMCPAGRPAVFLECVDSKFRQYILLRRFDECKGSLRCDR